MWPMVGKASGSAFMSSIHAKLVLSNIRVCGVCCPVYITERDGVHTVVVQWWLLNVTPRERIRSRLGKEKSNGMGWCAYSWSVTISRMLGCLVMFALF
jgi:hypothetical protein